MALCFRYVAPAPIENLLIAHHHVELACVSGQSQPQPFAIIHLSEGVKKKAAKGPAEREEVAKDLEVYLTKDVNPQLEPHEQLDYLVIVNDEWLPENGFLTPTQKIKRSKLEETYGPHADAWQNEKKKVIWWGW